MAETKTFVQLGQTRKQERVREMIPAGTWWLKTHPEQSLSDALDNDGLSKQKPDYSNDDVVSRPKLQRVRMWLEPLGPAKLAKVRSVTR